MKNCTLLFCALLFFAFGKGQSMQASVINVSGGTYSSQNYSYEWSIGELVLVNEMKDAGNNYVLTNGFLQPFMRSENAQKPPAVFRQQEFRVLNNPVKDLLRVQLATSQPGRLMLCVYDDRGNIVSYREVSVPATGTIENVDMRGVTIGTYFLKASFNAYATREEKTQTYKLLKIH